MGRMGGENTGRSVCVFGRLREKSKSRENGQETKKQEWNVNLSSGSEKAYKTRVQLQAAAVNQWTVLFSLSDSVKLAASSS